jgi:hypothetical protein
MSTHTERKFQVTQIEMSLETSHADFTRAFESVLGRMRVESLGDLPSLSPKRRARGSPRSWGRSTSRFSKRSTMDPL